MNGFGRDVRVGIPSSAVLFLALALPCAAQTGPSCDELARDLPRFTNDTVTFYGTIDHVAVIMGLVAIRLKCVTAAGDTVPGGEFAFVLTMYRRPSSDGPTGGDATGVMRVTGVVREPGFYRLFPAPLNGPDDRFRGPWLDQVQIMTCPALPCTTRRHPSHRAVPDGVTLSERQTR